MILATLFLTITLSLPQVVTGPTNHIPDSNTFMFNNHLYVAAGTTYIYSDTGLIPVLSPGPDFDKCGAWLYSAVQDGPVTRGFYHAEDNCGYDYQYNSRWTIAYAESYDGGLTWVKPDYPHNQIIKAPAYIEDWEYDGEGEASVVRNGDYYYLYFLLERYRRVGLARSLITDGGRPGTWYKWYNGSFSQPGLGGESTPIAEPWVLRSRSISWNDYLQKWVGLHHRNNGWGLSVSDDGLNWQPVDCTIVEGGDNWSERTSTPFPLVGYLSFVPTGGEDSRLTGQDFWIYFLRLNPSESYDKRYLMRQRVIVEGLPGDGCTVQTLDNEAWLPVVEKGD